MKQFKKKTLSFSNVGRIIKSRKLLINFNPNFFNQLYWDFFQYSTKHKKVYPINNIIVYKLFKQLV